MPTISTKTYESRPRRGKGKKKDVLDWSSFEEKKQKTRPNVSLREVIHELTYYDLNAPYQRDECWGGIAERNLIQSIFRSIPIGAIHLVRKGEKSAFHNVLDAKQRISAIKHFIENKFSIKYKGQEYKWDDLKREENKWLLDIFHKYEMILVEWEPMTIALQKNLFEIINLSASLNVAERIYCPNFLARSILKYIYKNCFKDLTDSIRGEIKNDKRFSGVMWAHRICQIIYGPLLNDSFSIRALNKSSLIDSAQRLDKIACDYFDKEVENFKGELITEKVIEDLGFEEQISFLKKLSEAILGCLNFKNPDGKKENAIDIMDFITFTAQKVQSEILTFAQIKDNKEIFFDFYKEFVDAKQENNLAKHTTDKISITNRHNIFNKLFDKLPIDKGFKNRPILESEKARAMLDFDGTCPVDGNYVPPSERRFDHVDPKSKTSETEVKIISKDANQLKSNLTEKNLQNTLTYIQS